MHLFDQKDIYANRLPEGKISAGLGKAEGSFLCDV